MGSLGPADPLPLKLGSRDWALGIWCISVIEDGGLSQVRLRQSCLSSMETESPLCLFAGLALGDSYVLPPLAGLQLFAGKLCLL